MNPESPMYAGDSFSMQAGAGLGDSWGSFPSRNIQWLWQRAPALKLGPSPISPSAGHCTGHRLSKGESWHTTGTNRVPPVLWAAGSWTLRANTPRNTRLVKFPLNTSVERLILISQITIPHHLISVQCNAMQGQSTLSYYVPLQDNGVHLLLPKATYLFFPEMPALDIFWYLPAKGVFSGKPLTPHVPNKCNSTKHTSTSLLVCSRNIAAYSFISFSLPFLAASMRTSRGTVVSKKESEMWSIMAFRSCKRKQLHQHLLTGVSIKVCWNYCPFRFVTQTHTHSIHALFTP